MKRLFISVVIIVFLSGSSFGQDYPVIAQEYCECFTPLKTKMEKEFQDLLIRVSQQKNVKAAFSKELDSLSADKVKLLVEQLEFVGTQLETDDNEAGKCGQALDKKYEKFTSTPAKEKDFTTKIGEELKKKKNCELLAAIIVFAYAFEGDD